MANVKPSSTLEEVFEWEEFKAFAKRLGIPRHSETFALKVWLRLDRSAEITLEFFGEDGNERSLHA